MVSYLVSLPLGVQGVEGIEAAELPDKRHIFPTLSIALPLWHHSRIAGCIPWAPRPLPSSELHATGASTAMLNQKQRHGSSVKSRHTFPIPVDM